MRLWVTLLPALLVASCSPDYVPASGEYVDTTVGRDPTPEPTPGSTATPVSTETPVVTPAATETPVASPTETPVVSPTATPTPTPAPQPLSVRVLSARQAPWVGVTVASALGDSVIDVSQPTDANGDTTVLASPGMLVTAYLRDGLVRLTALADGAPLTLVSSFNLGSTAYHSMRVHVSGAAPFESVWANVGCTVSNGTANASGQVTLSGEAYETCLGRSGTFTVAAGNHDETRWGAVTGVALATTSLSLALGASAPTMIDLDFANVPSGWWTAVGYEREELPLSNLWDPMLLGSSGHVSFPVVGASHADTVRVGVIGGGAFVASGAERRDGVIARKTFPASSFAIDLASLPAAVIDGSYGLSGDRLSVTWDSLPGTGDALAIAVTFRRDGSFGYWEVLLPVPAAGPQSFVFPPSPPAFDTAPLIAGGHPFLVGMLDADFVDPGDPLWLLFADEPSDSTLTYSCVRRNMHPAFFQ
jgi:hypothetical protein